MRRRMIDDRAELARKGVVVRVVLTTTHAVLAITARTHDGGTKCTHSTPTTSPGNDTPSSPPRPTATASSSEPLAPADRRRTHQRRPCGPASEGRYET